MRIAIVGIFCILSLTSIAAQETLFLPNGANFSVYRRGADTFILNQSRMTQLGLDRKVAQLSAGKRILSASDDPAGLAAAEKMEALLRGLKQDAMNDEDWKNYCSYADAMAAQDQEIVQRIRELIVQASSGILGRDDKQMIQDEISQLLAQIDANAAAKLNAARIIPELTAQGLGIDSIDVLRNNKSLDLADRALAKLTRKRVLEGTRANVLTFRIEGKAFHYVNQLASQSRITDQDMAEGVSDLMKSNAIVQTQNGLLLRQK
jgi:flagellin